MTTTQDGSRETSAAATGGHARTLPIAMVLALSFGLLVVLAVAAVLLIGFSTSRTNTLDLLNEKSTMIVGIIENGVRGHLDPALDQATFIHRQVEAGVLDLTDRARVADMLMGALAAAPQIAALAFWDVEQQQTVAFAQPDRQAGIDHDDHSGRADIRAVAARAKEADGPFWGELVFDEELGVTLVNLIQPLRYDGDYKGFSATVVSMPELSEFISEVGDQFAATAYILYGDDRVLAHPNLTSRHPDLTEANPAVRIDRVGDLVLANLWSGEPARGFERAAAAGVDVDVIAIGDATYVAFNGRIHDYGDVAWVVGAHVPAGQVNAELRRLVQSGLAGVGVLIIAIGAAVLLGRMLARPISRMAVSAAQVGALDLDAVKPLPQSLIRELQNQASAFNTMLGALRWFETYVPRKLVRRLMAGGSDGRLASAERELTILFTDIVGFTSLSEAMPATETAALLNDHFALLGACVEAEGGTIDKFIGDALMAFWGAPDEQPDSAARACRAALAMVDAIEADNVRRRRDGRPALRLRIGIHTGPVVVGNIGAPGRMNYTIVGDAVNAAQRLETLAKELDEGAAVTVLVSGTTVAGINSPDMPVTRVGEFEVRGKRALLEVFRLGRLG